MRIHFVSCIVIYRIEQREPWARRVNALLAASALVFVTTELTRLECRVRPLALGLVDVLRDDDAYFDQPALLWQACDRPVFHHAANLRAQHGLKTPDVLHLAAALIARCEEFWTNDHRFDAAATSSLRVVVPADRP
jgi:predicted nucleic acid-binding protein